MTNAQAGGDTQPISHYISYIAGVNEQAAQRLIAICSELVQQNVQGVYLLISSPGGSVMHGITLYNMLKAMPFKLITHNVGSVDSIGNVIFMSGEERYANAASTFMFHGVSFQAPPGVIFDEMLTKEKLDSIQADHNKIADVISKNSKLNVQEIEQYFLESRTKSPDEALADGIIHEVRDVVIPPGALVITV